MLIRIVAAHRNLRHFHAAIRGFGDNLKTEEMVIACAVKPHGLNQSAAVHAKPLMKFSERKPQNKSVNGTHSEIREVARERHFIPQGSENSRKTRAEKKIRACVLEPQNRRRDIP